VPQSQGKPRAFLTRLLPEPAPTILRGAFTLEGNLEDVQLTAAEMRAGVSGARAVVCTLTDRIDGELLDAAGPGLVVVSTCAVGFDNIDVGAASERGVLVATTPDVLTDATAELTWALILAAARRVAEGDRLVREGRFLGWSPSLLLGRELRGRVLGVVGMGRIGRAVAQIAHAFGMQVLYVRRGRAPEPQPMPPGTVWHRASTLDALLAEADVVTLHVPLSNETRHLISRRELALMKPGAILVNAARGPVIDERALVEALAAGRIFAAGLDVYAGEPSLTPGLAELPNVVLLPHLGSATEKTRRRMAEFAAGNAVAAVTGSGVVHAVNAEAVVAAAKQRARELGALGGDGVPFRA